MLATKTAPLTRWRPGESQRWNLRRVWHLHRRVGFGATWNELQRDLRDGPDAAIDRVVEAFKNSDRGQASGASEQMSSVICDAAVASNNIERLKAWWLYRMLNSSDPLGERLTLMWHNHFATSNVKVEDVGMMRRQNDSLRQHASKSFSTLLEALAKDPALLVWLDADANRKEHPNENLAREIMELFTLGVGNYSESDIKEAARALTGWTVKQEEFRNVADRHDADQKSIFGHDGNWDGDDFIRLLLAHPATPRRIAFRVCEMFMGETTVDDVLIDEIAQGLTQRDLDVGWAVETVLRSAAFFADANIGNRVLSPVEFVMGAVHALEINKPPPSTLLLAEVTGNLGQDLFCPPNVFGWPGGRSWLTSRAIIGRANFASALVTGQLHASREPFDATRFAKNFGYTVNDQSGSFFVRLLLGRTEIPVELRPFLKNPNRLVTAILSSPEALLG